MPDTTTRTPSLMLNEQVSKSSKISVCIHITWLSLTNSLLSSLGVMISSIRFCNALCSLTKSSILLSLLVISANLISRRGVLERVLRNFFLSSNCTSPRFPFVLEDVVHSPAGINSSKDQTSRSQLFVQQFPKLHIDPIAGTYGSFNRWSLAEKWEI